MAAVGSGKNQVLAWKLPLVELLGFKYCSGTSECWKVVLGLLLVKGRGTNK